MRGIDGENGLYELGIQIQLDAGWKTYWRNPGDSGIPPDFDWSRSQNIGSVDIRWPAPEWFSDAYGNSIGYHDEVVFPVAVQAADAAQPVTLDLGLSYAVCAEVCIPVMLELDLVLDELTSSPSHARLIAYYDEQVPLGTDGITGLEIADVAILQGADEISLVVDVLCEDPSRRVSIFLEGPETFYFAFPRELENAPSGHKRFSFPVDGAEAASDLAGAKLLFVVVDGEKRLEQAWVLR